MKNKSNVKNCKFDFTTLGPCGKEPYGYEKDSKPCIYIRLNRVCKLFQRLLFINKVKY